MEYVQSNNILPIKTKTDAKHSVDLRTILLSMSIIFYFAEDALSGFFSIALNLLGLGNPILVTGIVCFLTYLPIAYIVVHYRDVRILDSVLLLSAIALMFLFSYYNNPQNEYFFTRDIYGMERVFRPDRAIYAYLIIRVNSDDSDRVWKALRIVSLVLFVYWSLVLVNALGRGYWEDYDENGTLIHMQYNLTFGYSLLLPIAFFFFDRSKKWSSLYCILIVAGIFEIFIAGSRGPLICIGIMLLIQLFRSLDKAWAAMLLLLLLTFFLVLLIVGPESILSYLKGVLDTFNISSRTLDRLISGTVTDENGRDLIWAASLQAIQASPVVGYGVYGDRAILYGFHFAGYPHNIILELALQFGLFATFVFVGIAIYVSLKLLFGRRNDRWGDLFAVFLVSSCQLLLSMSFWYVSAFWAAIAVAVNAFSAKSKTNNGNL